MVLPPILICVLLHLKVKENLPSIVSFIEKIQFIQHDGVIQHCIDYVLPHYTSNLRMEDVKLYWVVKTFFTWPINMNVNSWVSSISPLRAFLSASSLFLCNASAFSFFSYNRNNSITKIPDYYKTTLIIFSLFSTLFLFKVLALFQVPKTATMALVAASLSLFSLSLPCFDVSILFYFMFADQFLQVEFAN